MKQDARRSRSPGWRRWSPRPRRGDDRADRQVDAAGDDDEGHADGDDTDDGRLGEDSCRLLVSRNSSGLVMPPMTTRAASTPSRERRRGRRRGPAGVVRGGGPGGGAGWVMVPGPFGASVARAGRSVLVARRLPGAAAGCRAHAAELHWYGPALPSMTRSSTRCSSRSAGGRRRGRPRPRGAPGPGRRGRGPRAPRWRPAGREAVVGEAADDGVELGAGADVHAPGRLVEEQDPAAAQQPAGEDGLLLVAAGEGAHGRGRVVGAQGQLAGRGPRGAAFGAAVEPASVREAGHGGDGDIAGDGLQHQQGLRLALLGGEAEPGADGGAYAAGPQRLPVDDDLSGSSALRAP